MGPIPVAPELQPVSRDRLASLLVREFSTRDGEQITTECGICLEEYRAGDQLWELPACRHDFHVACLGEWFRSQSTCPYCRQTV
ncbi:unnamed protein product [Linum trigynum]|uniref:RING-type domain-containing protein n=1 Tax=Linum trigynum TaxID=586398 RepID=A0AAV2EF57_9ROSI